MVPERDLAVLVAAGLGLAYVMEQRGQPHHQVVGRLGHHGNRVREHILVTMYRILLHLERGQLRHDLPHPAAVDTRPEPGRGSVAAEQPAEFFAELVDDHP